MKIFFILHQCAPASEIMQLGKNDASLIDMTWKTQNWANIYMFVFFVSIS